MGFRPYAAGPRLCNRKLERQLNGWILLACWLSSGWIWMILTGSGRLCLAVAGSGWLCWLLVGSSLWLAGSSWLWVALDDSGWIVAGLAGWLWLAPAGSGWLWQLANCVPNMVQEPTDIGCPKWSKMEAKTEPASQPGIYLLKKSKKSLSKWLPGPAQYRRKAI